MKVEAVCWIESSLVNLSTYLMVGKRTSLHKKSNQNWKSKIIGLCVTFKIKSSPSLMTNLAKSLGEVHCSSASALPYSLRHLNM